MITGYLAHIDFESQLREELKNSTEVYGRLFLTEGPPQKVHWAQNIWYDVERISFSSISEAAQKLRERQALWTYHSHDHARRAALIQERLPYFSPKPLAFPSSLPKPPLGAWTLIQKNELLAASSTESPVPHGEFHFQECKDGPPSRAYLKLWEALIRLQDFPKPNEICLEVGASPGSWTWALQKLGAKVYAFDKAVLAPGIAELPRVSFAQKDAFSILPKDFPDVKWIFCDVICYPEKLLSWITAWLDAGTKATFICTVKFQGEEHYQAVKKFAAIKGSHLFHLFHNKHELTWILKQPN